MAVGVFHSPPVRKVAPVNTFQKPATHIPQVPANRIPATREPIGGTLQRSPNPFKNTFASDAEIPTKKGIGFETDTPNSKLTQESPSQHPSVKSEIALEAIDAVCGMIVEDVLKQINDPENSDAATLAKTIWDGIMEQRKSTKFEGKNKTCILSGISSAVEWSAQVIDQQTIGSTESVTCETMKKCTITSPGANTVYLVFYPQPKNILNPSKRAISLDGHDIQSFDSVLSKPYPNQSVVYRRGLPVELDTLSSSATTFHQSSFFNNSSSVTLTMALMLMLYMYIFNFRR